jgi:4-amino-4-deoxy-L-arabinose transferase-like glycosyltransferase
MSLTKILSHKSTIWYVLLFGFLIRLLVVVTADPYGEDTLDGLDYHNHAITLLNGGDYPSHGSLPFIRPPLYPFLLSIVYRFVPHESYLTARLLNIVIDIAACFIFYKLIMLIWNNRPTAIISTLIYTVNPLFLFFSAKVRVEALFTLLVVSGIYLLVREAKKDFPNIWKLFFIGAVFGLVCLCRSNGTAILILIPLWLIYCKMPDIRKSLLLAVIFILGCVATVAPWSIRNYEKYGEPILITDGFGYAFWISNTELKFDDLYARNHQEYVDADNKLWKSFGVIEEQIKGKSIKQRDNYYFNLGMDYIKNNFTRWIWLNILKSAEFWSPMARYDMQGSRAFATLPFGLLMYLGLFFYIKSFFSKQFDRKVWYLILLLIIASMGTGVLTWSSVRFRVPLVDAYIIPFGIFWLQNKFKRYISSDEMAETVTE